MKIPLFETPRLILKELTLQDAPAYQKHFADYEIIRNLAAPVPWPYPANGASEFLAQMALPGQGKNRWIWGIFLKSQPNEVIGAVDLWREGKPEHRGFWLAHKHWGQGFMSEAVAPVMDYAFLHLDFQKLIFANAVGNLASRRVKEKTGARLIQVKPAKFVDPGLSEHEIWELEKAEWLTRMREPALMLRPAALQDAKTLESWDHEPHVISGTTDNEDVEKAFGDHDWRRELLKQCAESFYCIAEVSWRAIGAMQITDPHLEETHYWGEIEPNLRSVDIWIGEMTDLGKGYGEQMMRLAHIDCFSDPSVKAIVIDPLNSNARAHKFYQRMGYQPLGRQNFGEDDCLVHKLTREKWEELFSPA